MYKIILNYFGEIHVFYRNCRSEKMAKNYAILELEQKVGKVKFSLFQYFNKMNFEVIKMK